MAVIYLSLTSIVVTIESLYATNMQLTQPLPGVSSSSQP